MEKYSNLRNKYFIKQEDSGYIDICDAVDGVRVLKIDGFLSKGKPKNIYTASWVNSQQEDFAITTYDEGEGDYVVYNENTDIEVTFITGERYAKNAIDVREAHDDFVNLFERPVYIKSSYVDKEVLCVRLSEYSPETIKLKRGANSSYILGKLTLHTLDAPKTNKTRILGNFNYGFGDETLTNIADVFALDDLHAETFTSISKANIFDVECTRKGYLWVCAANNDMAAAFSWANFEIPMISYGLISGSDELYCYRSANIINPHTMRFNVENTQLNTLQHEYKHFGVESYIGGSTKDVLRSIYDMKELDGVLHTLTYGKGTRSIALTSNEYIWICTTDKVNNLTIGDDYAPIEYITKINDFNCYRTSAKIKRGTKNLQIS